MFKILKKEELSPNVFSMDIEAPRVAKKALPGQFIVLRVDEKGERIPLTIANYNQETGAVNLVFQVIGASTMKLAELNEGDSIVDFVGPLGQPSEIRKFDGTVVVVGGGIGVAPTFPIARAMKEAGNKVIAIMGAKTEDILIMEDEMKAVTDEILITTDDGSLGSRGVTSDLLPQLLISNAYDRIVVCGPEVMMRSIAHLAQQYGIPCQLSLEKRMACGLGACLSCSCDTNSGQRKKVCKDGPVFWAQEVL